MQMGTEQQSPPREPSADFRADLADASRRLEAAQPPAIIRWAVDRFGDKLTMATAFGPEGCLIIHWLATIAPQIFVFNLETGYQFPETLRLRDQIASLRDGKRPTSGRGRGRSRGNTSRIPRPKRS